MFEIISAIVFLLLMGKALKLVFKLTWGAAKVIAAVLMVVAAPLLVLGLVFAWGLALLVPLALAGLAVGIGKLCL